MFSRKSRLTRSLIQNLPPTWLHVTSLESWRFHGFPETMDPKPGDRRSHWARHRLPGCHRQMWSWWLGGCNSHNKYWNQWAVKKFHTIKVWSKVCYIYNIKIYYIIYLYIHILHNYSIYMILNVNIVKCSFNTLSNVYRLGVPSFFVSKIGSIMTVGAGRLPPNIEEKRIQAQPWACHRWP